MPFIDTAALEVLNKRPGWRGGMFHSPQMSFAYWEFDAGSDIHGHSHKQEEVWHVIEGDLEVTIGREKRIAGPGMAAIIPKDTKHSVVARTNGRAIVADFPVRGVRVARRCYFEGSGMGPRVRRCAAPQG